MRREETHPHGGSRELLSRSERRQRTGGDGSDGARALVRALAGGAELRAVDWRPGRDTRQTGAETEDGPPGCRTLIAVAGGESLSTDLGTESRESRSAAAALASASAGADADASQEPAPGHCPERRNTTPERVVEQAGAGQLESLVLAPWSTRRRQDLLELLDRLNPRIEELSAAIQQATEERPEVQRLMTHPGVGPITALAFVLILGVPDRFRCGKQVGSYLGLIPCEESSGGHQRLGHISKQGNTLLRFLLIESAHALVRYDPDWRRFLHLAMRRGRHIAKVAMARRLAVRLYWMWRKGWDHQQTVKFGSHVG